uniref:Kynureninase n=1 Tax=Parascaris equorum TaxID=6256 RepID=A0A914RDK8_PAREQ
KCSFKEIRTVLFYRYWKQRTWPTDRKLNLPPDALLKNSHVDNAINEEATCSTSSDHLQMENVTEHEGSEMDLNSYLSEHLRDEFHYPKMKTIPHVDYSLVNEDDDSVYMCGNSLGLMLKSTRKYMDIQFEKWANMGVCGHTEDPLPWAHCDETVTEGIAKLVGAEPSEVALMNGLTVNMHILLTAFYKPTKNRHKILLESKAFPSDHYAVESQIRLKGFTDEDCLRIEDILSVIEREGDSIAVIVFSGLQYYTGQLFDIETITKAGHKKWDVDFACWCTYKYGSSGAGGLAGAFVHSKYNGDKRERMVGWWAHKADTRFIMDNKLELDDGAAGYRISDVKNIVGRTQKEVQCSIMTPSDPKQRGCQLSLKFNVDIAQVFEELTKRGVVV